MSVGGFSEVRGVTEAGCTFGADAHFVLRVVAEEAFDTAAGELCGLPVCQH